MIIHTMEKLKQGRTGDYNFKEVSQGSGHLSRDLKEEKQGTLTCPASGCPNEKEKTMEDIEASMIGMFKG